MSRWVFVTLCVMLSTALSGCLSGDDATPTDEEVADEVPQAKATATAGSLTGKVVSKDLIELVGATVTLTSGETAVDDATTGIDGTYVMNQIEPGQYFITFAAEGHKAATKPITVVANEVTEASIMLPGLTDTELAVPTVEKRELQGFLSCGIGQTVPGVVSAAWSTCSTLGNDPNDKFLFQVELFEGAREVVVGMTWEPVGGVSGTELVINMEMDGCGALCEDNQTYQSLKGSPDLIFSVNDADLDERTDPAFDENLKFRNVDEMLTFQFRVFPGQTESPNVVYQQPFTIYYEVYYFQDAPEGRNPIPEI